MAKRQWTEAQRQAIETMGSSLLVSAGAGSGKTSVLSQRCVHLIAHPEHPCGVDRLLVVTFTEAAATEMRERIDAALRARLAETPSNAWLRRQSALLDTGLICTLHGFCRRMLDRYFAQARIDPAMPIMDPTDAGLLRHEAAQAVFDAFANYSDEQAEAVHQLISAYGYGREDRVIDRLLGLDGFLSSLPDPESWLDEAVARFEGRPEELSPYRRGLLLERLREELREQRRFVEDQVSAFGAHDKDAARLAAYLNGYVEALALWHKRVSTGTDKDIDWVCHDAMPAFKFPTIPRLLKHSSMDPATFEANQDRCEDIKEKLFNRRLLKRFGRFSLAEWAEGIARTRPHAETFVRLTRAFRERFAKTKRELGVLDFGDLERFTLDLLSDEENGVASRLRDRFEHVLVDEFQDINPVQAEILRLVSREGDPVRRGNLFTVGDIKQSIYRFRLAEPRLFQERLQRFAPIGAAADDSAGRAIDLVANFRSRRGVIDAINGIFERVMVPELAGLAYDDRARLRFGREDDAASAARFAGMPGVELHILDGDVAEPLIEPELDEDEAETATGGADEWERIEREGFVIAQRIQDLTARGVPHGDIVILLRSLKGRAPLLVRTLVRLGIPVHADAPGGFLESTEVQDVLALLALLDNPEQDIPWATVLRSPIFGEPIGEEGLVAIRTADGTGGADMPFHACVTRYAREGRDADLCRRVSEMIDRLAAWRMRMRHRPIAEVLWEIYESSGYMAYTAGLADAPQRRANLLALHERARACASFGRSGLYRFLRVMDELRDADEDLAAGVVPPVDGNAVRIMSIHRSKGLEFPVVIVAELGKRFNMMDAMGVIQFDRTMGLGLIAVDVERRITYPTLPHRMVGGQARLECLAEEMRILYVATTRAREKLILVGTMPLKRIEGIRARYVGWLGTLPLTQLQTAQCLLDWLVPAVATENRSAWSLSSEAHAGAPADTLFDVRTYSAEAMSEWAIEPPAREDVTARLEACAALETVRPVSSAAAGTEALETIQRRLTTPYPAASLTRIPAVAAASELKRHWHSAEEEADWTDQSVQTGRGVRHHSFRRPSFLSSGDPGDATDRGTRTHAILERLDLAGSCDAATLRAQIDAMIEQGLLPPCDGDDATLADIGWFVQTDLGLRLRRDGTRVHREWPFVIGADPRRFDPTASPCDPRDTMLVRGVIDCLFDAGDGWEILDYKTDRVSGAALTERAQLYRGQMAIYGEAVAEVFRTPVRRRWLAFLTARTIVEV